MDKRTKQRAKQAAAKILRHHGVTLQPEVLGFLVGSITAIVRAQPARQEGSDQQETPSDSLIYVARAT